MKGINFMKNVSDTELLDWLEAVTHKGYCPSVIFDDNGHWAVSFSGAQNIYSSPFDTAKTIYVRDYEWKNTIREAILAVMKKVKI